MNLRVLLSSMVLTLIFAVRLWACESCSIARLGRDEGAAGDRDGKWFFKYVLEEQNWHEKEGAEAHRLHHQGHHFHDKTREQFHHFALGTRVAEPVTVSVEWPYVVRHSIEVDDHAIVGARQKSEGAGDLRLMGDYRFFQGAQRSASVVGGVKFPTGDTREDNTAGTRFETELQPGSGSYDYLLGGVYRREIGRFGFTGNGVYVFKNAGEQNFEFGDLFSASLLTESIINPESALKINLGLDANFQYEQKQKDHGARIKDSGGVTLLLGPTASVKTNQNVAVFASFLAPVFQDLGGAHQTLDYVWTAGGRVDW